ncbi:MAG: hypothetical protein IKB56_07450 [Clostridia bacterium]|nr:hypothetical protein [Clostridia bacterium]
MDECNVKEEKVVTFIIKDDVFETSKEGFEFYRHTCEIAYKHFADELVKALKINVEYRAKTNCKSLKVDEVVAQCNWLIHDAVPQIVGNVLNSLCTSNKL